MTSHTARSQQTTELVGDDGGFTLDAPVGEANYAIPLDLHRGISSAITLECLSVTVERPAVCLHHEPLLRPECINLPTENVCADDWGRQLIVATELKDTIL